MRANVRSPLKRRHTAKFGVFTVGAILILANMSCFMPNPALTPVQDVLQPAASVRVVGFTIAGEHMRIGDGEHDIAVCADGDVIVTQDFILWVESLKIEIKELRRRTQ